MSPLPSTGEIKPWLNGHSAWRGTSITVLAKEGETEPSTRVLTVPRAGAGVQGGAGDEHDSCSTRGGCFSPAQPLITSASMGKK